MTTRSTKKSLMLSCLALLLCFSMLIGTTFAWFTDEVTSKGNIIKSGTLDIEMLYADGDEALDAAKWKDASKDAIFNSKLWEPGYTDAKHINIKNNGTLALKYQLLIEPTGEVSDLANVIDVYFIEGGKQLTRDALDTYAPQGTLADLIKGGIAFGSLTAGQNRIFTIVLKMQETAGNEYQDKSIGSDFAIKLLATQLTSEKDSFGPDYDMDAWHPAMEVYSANDLQAALNNGETNIKLMADIELTESIVIPAPAATTYSLKIPAILLDLNGKKITAGANEDYALENANGAAVVINDSVGTAVVTGIVYTGTNSATVVNGGTYNAKEGGTYVFLNSSSSLTINKATVNGGSSYPVYSYNDGHKLIINDITINATFGCVNAYAAGTVEINGGNFYMTGVKGKTSHLVYFSGSTKATINGGTFEKIGDIDMSGTGGGGICTMSSAELVINGGTFAGSYRDLYVWSTNSKITVQGGTYKFSPTSEGAKIADGFKAVEKNGKFFVLSDEVNSVVATSSELATAIAQGGIVYVVDDIDMGNAWTSVKPGSALTILGNGNTITNLNKPLLTGGVSSKVTVKGLTIANSNVGAAAFENGLGSGAIIPYVDAYGNVAIEDCHLVNTTVTGNERVGGFVGYTSGQTVTIKNSSVTGCTLTAVGGAGALIGYSQSVVTVENSSVTDTKVTATEDRLGTKTPLAGAVIGTVNGNTTLTNVTVSNNTVSNNNALPVYSNCIGRKVSGNLTIDGAYVLPAATTESLNNAIASGNTNVYLPAGNYTMPSSGNSNALVITGTKDTVVDVTLGAYMDYANVTFEGVTIKTGTGKVNGNGSDYAAFYSKDVTYKNCTFEGPMRVGRDGAKFIECTFNNLGNDYVWTYGNDVTFERCTFNTDGKAILVYSDGGNEVAKVTVKDCTFNSTQGAKAGAIANQNCAAIEIHNYGNGVDLVTEGNTYDANFSGEWRIKTYENGRTKVFVNGTEYTTIAIDGKIMTIDANKNVTVQ